MSAAPQTGDRTVNLTVGVSDAKVSRHSDDVLMTHALGSCIGVALFDPASGIAGMLHFQLPSSTADPAKGLERPLMFADTGLRWLLEQMKSLGAENRRLKVHLAGGASMLNDTNLFDIGRRNHTAVRKLLYQQRLFITAEQIGGTQPRTMIMNVGNGSVSLRSGGHTTAM
jgi:chemotaxis protein CheD